MDLPPAADAMYKTWWAFAQYAAQATNPDGSWAYSVTDASSAASQINRDVYGGQGGYNPIGLSQLFSIARKIGNSTAALAAADPASPITDAMVQQAPWSRPLAEQTASPQWQARVLMTYTDPLGIQLQEYTVVTISQVLPSSITSLNAQLALRIQDQLSAPPGTGTPREGALDSIDSVTLLAVLDGHRRDSPLRQASRKDPHPGLCHVRGRRNVAGPAGINRGPHASAMESAAGPKT